MTRGLLKTGVLAAMLVAGLAAAHAQGIPDPVDPGGPSPGDPDLTMQRPVQAWHAAPGDAEGEGADAKADPLDAASLQKHGPSAEYPLAPHVELVTGYGPYTAFDTPDLEPRLGEFAVGIKLDF